MTASAQPVASMVMSVAGSSPMLAQTKAEIGNTEEDADEGEEIAQLWDAVFEGDKLTIESMLVGDEEHPPLSGASVDMKDENGMTPLHWLTIEGHASTAQWLIDEVKAMVDCPDGRTRQTPLHFAASKGQATIAGLLLHRGADPLARDHAGWTPLHAAARSGFCDAAQVILGSLSEDQVNTAGPKGQTALHRAAFWGHLDMCALLLQHGARKAQGDHGGRQPFEMACGGEQNTAMMPALLKLLRGPSPAESA